MTWKKPETLSDKLRRAIVESRLTHLQIEKETGIKRQSLLLFVRSEQTLRLDAAEKLMEFFGIEWTQPRKPKRPTK